jgi:two-component system nitrate/nitrite response regulator NarL
VRECRLHDARRSGGADRTTYTARVTPRESEIVQLIERVLSTEIGQHLSIQVPIVKNHVHNVLEKLGVSRRADAARLAP